MLATPALFVVDSCDVVKAPHVRFIERTDKVQWCSYIQTRACPSVELFGSGFCAFSRQAAWWPGALWINVCDCVVCVPSSCLAEGL